ncbi:hypothetical protein [Iningainema tapete]|uniref:Uncharacterized protein n=1 Tax=Iningainema tapete BLCC-T55 TaxID=2748662 RepID=A0A8J6XJX0_9CYAN|nr:hypothetical protein [Iningainema tapete]MBD2778280.1 hypothetical protein [Iningainema tapete BLCC-T55]
MTKNLPYIIPATPPEAEEAFAGHQITHQFYQEVQARADFKRHCEWYHTTADANRQELERMRSEPNIFRWFLRK